MEDSLANPIKSDKNSVRVNTRPSKYYMDYTTSKIIHLTNE